MTQPQTQFEIYNHNRKVYKAGKKRTKTVMFCAFLCLSLLNFAMPIFQWLYSLLAPYAHQGMAATTFLQLFNIFIYVFCISVPFCICAIACKAPPSKIFPIKPKLTKKPIGYTIFVFGICLLFNIILNMLFPWCNDLFGSETVIYESTTDMILHFVQVAVLPAILEEFAFRGVCITCLRPMGTRFAVVASAMIFGLSHLNPTQSLFAFLFGLLIGGAFVATGSVWPGVLVHFLNNAISVIGVYGNDGMAAVVGLFMYAAMIYSVVYLIKYLKEPGVYPIFITEKQEPLLSGDGFTPTRGLFTNGWTYAFWAIYAITVFSIATVPV